MIVHHTDASKQEGDADMDHYRYIEYNDGFIRYWAVFNGHQRIGKVREDGDRYYAVNTGLGRNIRHGFGATRDEAVREMRKADAKARV